MSKQIAAALNVAEQFVTDVTVDGKNVEFRLNGVWYWAKLSRGRFIEENMHRANY